MWKLFKWLVFIIIVAVIVLWVTGYKIGGRTIQDYARGIVGAKNYDEGVKDIRSLVGEAVKAVGDAISPEPTQEEKQELEGVIKKELEGAEAAKPETAKQVPAAPPAKVETQKKEGGK